MLPLHPGIPFGLALVFVILSLIPRFSQRATQLQLIAAGWVGFGLWELYMRSWRSGTGDRAIRIDLLLQGPLMLALLGLGLFVLTRPSGSDPDRSSK